VDSGGKERLPFTDGHNPSVVSLKSNPYSTKSNNTHVRLDHRHLQPIAKALLNQSLDSLFMGITVFGSGQCKFGLTPQDVDTFRFSAFEEVPNGKRAVISIHSSWDTSPPFQTLIQTTLLLERDAKYGTNRRALPTSKDGNAYARMHQEFDDPRFFFHRGRIWVLYRNGPLFGYNDQIHNPVHFEKISNGGGFVAFVKASETVRVCCGRNIALISEESEVNDHGVVSWVENPTLKALTWVDPVTVVNVNIDTVGSLNKRRLGEAAPSFYLPETHKPQDANNHRRLKADSSPKSHIHGTNGYMVPLPSTGELLGIAHFHRPEHRQSSEYALHGHHYTHVFFTIARHENGEDSPFKLKRLSNEFMFQSQYSPIGKTAIYDDGDIIQFASGLDDVDGTLIISYGINDCEGAVFTLSMKEVSSLLVDVQLGQEVVDLMSKVTKEL
jgi:hypothetical protein